MPYIEFPYFVVMRVVRPTFKSRAIALIGISRSHTVIKTCRFTDQIADNLADQVTHHLADHHMISQSHDEYTFIKGAEVAPRWRPSW